MTIRAVEPIRLGKGLEGPEPLRPAFCEGPSCTEQPSERHHCIRRSLLGGPFDWVEIDGETVCNVMFLCSRHHRYLTGGIGGHVAKLSYNGAWMWVWLKADPESREVIAAEIEELAELREQTLRHPNLSDTDRTSRVASVERPLQRLNQLGSNESRVLARQTERREP